MRVTVGFCAPTPVSVIVCTPLLSLSVKVMLPASVCAFVGEKVALTVQDANAFNDVPHVFVTVYPCDPVMALIERVEEPTFVTVTDLLALVEPTVCVPKSKAVVDSLILLLGTTTEMVTARTMLPLEASSVTG